MKTPTIYDPSKDDSLGALRGGGRIVSILRENLSNEARFVSDLSKVSEDDTLLIPLWRLFQPPLLSKRIAKKQYLMIFDAIPIKHTEHFPVGLKGRWRMFQNLRSLSVFDKIITISDHSKEDLIDFMQIHKDVIEVVYPTTSKAYYEPLTKKDTLTKAQLSKKYNLPDEPYCMYVGDANWNKNIVNTALAVMKAEVPCVFVGNTFALISELRAMDEGERQEYFASSPLINHPEQRDFKEFIKLTIHDEETFIFPGYVKDTHIMQIYRHAVCGLLLSRDEGFGLTCLEAATQKCPSVLADTNIFHETAGDTALYADPEMPEKIAAQITTMFQDKKTRNNLAKAAYARSKKFAPSAFKKGMLSVLES